MEPKLPAPNFSPERTPGEYSRNIESLPVPPTPETGFERGEKPMEQQGETTAPSLVNPPVLPTPVVQQVPAISTPQSAGLPQINTNPSVANDDDLIEKEWVDKAKQIIAETRDDPHRREKEVGALQRDYLRKRYGKELGDS